jgi:hypothetical protein
VCFAVAMAKAAPNPKAIGAVARAFPTVDFLLSNCKPCYCVGGLARSLSATLMRHASIPRFHHGHHEVICESLALYRQDLSVNTSFKLSKILFEPRTTRALSCQGSPA